MSDSSDSSITEEESLSLEPPEEESYDQNEFDAEEQQQEQKEAPVTLTHEPAITAATAAVAVPPLSFEFRSLLQAQPQPFSPIKERETATAASHPPALASVSAPAPAPAVAPAPQPPALGILDPQQRPADLEAARALSRSEPLSMLGRLLDRLRRKQQEESALPRDSAAMMTAVRPVPSSQSAVPLPPAVLGSLVDRIRAAAPPASKASWALQPDLLPVVAPPLRSYSPRTTVLQSQLDAQRAAFFSAAAAVAPAADGKENAIVMAVSADPSYEAPNVSCSALEVDSRMTSASRFPPTAQPLQLAVAQTRMQAALLSMKTHQFCSAYSLPQSNSTPDFGATVLPAELPAAMTTALDAAAPFDAPLPLASTRHACSNPAAMHRDAWLDPVLNRLYATRMNPSSCAEEQQATHQLHATIVQTNSLRTQRDLFHAANRSFFSANDGP